MELRENCHFLTLVFSTVLSEIERDIGEFQWLTYIQDWFLCQILCFISRKCLQDKRSASWDTSTWWVKGFPACKLIRQIEKALNYNWLGKRIPLGMLRLSQEMVWYHLRVKRQVGASMSLQGLLQVQENIWNVCVPTHSGWGTNGMNWKSWWLISCTC